VTSDSSADKWFFNGVDGASGEYAVPPMTPKEVFALAVGASVEEAERADLESRRDELQRPHAGVEADARNLAETGWGVLFAQADPQAAAIREALMPLLRHRQAQAGEKYREYFGPEGYLPGESKIEWLDRHGMGPGPVNPERIPYYLLLVGSPEVIPFNFQYQLDIQYAVGRLGFDTLEEYASYAQSVVAAETGLALRPRATFFGVANAGDRATNLSLNQLVQPLAQRLSEKQPRWAELAQQARAAAGQPGRAPRWQFGPVVGEAATKARLSEVLHAPDAPAILFTASHGVSFPSAHERQAAHQGALLCQDWPGPEYWRGPLKEDFYFAADDLSRDANLLGTLAFFFACYGAGTPAEDEFTAQRWGEAEPARKAIAPHAFLARLPTRMLGLPKGGALAVVGHVERAWGCSFMWGSSGGQLQVFEDCLARLLKDYPVGYAVEVFNNRYAEISSDLIPALERHRSFGKKVDEQEIAGLWTANNDARNYMVLGDPAARLAVRDEAEAQAERPVITLSHAAPAFAPAEPASFVPEPAAATHEPAGPAPEPAPPVPTPAGGAVDYGLIDNFRQAQANVGHALQEFTEKLGTFMSQALEEATSLEIVTYASETLDQVRYEGGHFVGAERRAWTRISVDGDIDVCVPVKDGEVDSALWTIHSEMVQQAQTTRAELLKTLVSAATNLMSLWKP
jgi:hypothetical protein